MNQKQFIDESMTRDMPGLDYSPVSKRLSENNSLMRLLHASIGMSGETGEVLDNLKKSVMYGKELDRGNLLEECGDILYYMAVMLHELNSDFEQVMQMNCEKLRKRYPNGFSEKDAMERKDKVKDVTDEILENHKILLKRLAEND
jgi:NTP pyrophosphatase (non-canonical NTP hydrolase)